MLAIRIIKISDGQGLQPCESTTTMGECFINNIAGEAIGSIYFNYVGVGTRIQLIIGVCNSTPFINAPQLTSQG
jgi:hypothetical protein